MIHCPISHYLLEAASELLVFGQLSVAEYLQSEVLSLSTYPQLTSREAEYVRHAIKQWDNCL